MLWKASKWKVDIKIADPFPGINISTTRPDTKATHVPPTLQTGLHHPLQPAQRKAGLWLPRVGIIIPRTTTPSPDNPACMMVPVTVGWGVKPNCLLYHLLYSVDPDSTAII